MFTGIIESIGTITHISHNGSNVTFTVQSPISHELKIDQSISHNGICLTVEAVQGDSHTVTAIDETLQKTNAGQWQTGHLLNLERCMVMNGRIDGHIVQGHVDTTAVCTAVKHLDGSHEFTFAIDERFAHLVIEKGSISVNGTSLTCYNVTRNSFTIAVIPYTYQHTNIHTVQPESTVNIEFDMIGKYIHRFTQLQQS